LFADNYCALPQNFKREAVEINPTMTGLVAGQDQENGTGQDTGSVQQKQSYLPKPQSLRGKTLKTMGAAVKQAPTTTDPAEVTTSATIVI